MGSSTVALAQPLHSISSTTLFSTKCEELLVTYVKNFTSTYTSQQSVSYWKGKEIRIHNKIKVCFNLMIFYKYTVWQHTRTVTDFPKLFKYHKTKEIQHGTTLLLFVLELRLTHLFNLSREKCKKTIHIQLTGKRMHLAYTYVLDGLISFRYFCGCHGNDNIAIYGC